MKDSLFPDLPQESEPPAASSRKWLIYILVAAGLVGILVLPVLLGPSQSDTEDDIDAVDAEKLAQQEEERLLAEVVELIQPSRLGVDATESFVAEELNRWWLEYGSGRQDSDAQADSPSESLHELLGDDAADLALADEFSRRDVAHLASALTLRQAGLMLTTGLDDREKATAAFYFVIRNIEVVADPSAEPATYPYQSLLWGHARAEDRIWVFVELLRQIRIDSFLVVPAEGDANHPLVAVAIEEGILLFDPAFGLPIPSLTAESDVAVLPQVAATYAEALENDAVFRQFDAPDAPYPWTADALRNVKFLVVGSDSTFAPRMQALQQKLPSQFTFVAFDGWSASEIREGSLQERIESVAEQLPDVTVELDVWTYPLIQSASYDLSNGLDGTQLADRTLRMDRPLVIQEDTDAQGNVTRTHVPALRTLQMERAAHIQANFNDAMVGYLPMRNADNQNPRSENVPVEEVSSLWATLCQFEVDRPDLAITGFQQYLRDYGNGQFAVSANYWMAVSRAMNGEAQAALDALQAPALEAIPPGHLKYLADRWTRLTPAAVEESDEAPASSDASEEVDEP